MNRCKVKFTLNSAVGQVLFNSEVKCDEIRFRNREGATVNLAALRYGKWYNIGIKKGR